jgi:hypothetical protein
MDFQIFFDARVPAPLVRLELPIETKGHRVCEGLPGIFKYFLTLGCPPLYSRLVLLIETKGPRVCEGLPGIFKYLFDASVPAPLVPAGITNRD